MEYDLTDLIMIENGFPIIVEVMLENIIEIKNI
jgi:hypothetical protein